MALVHEKKNRKRKLIKNNIKVVFQLKVTKPQYKRVKLNRNLIKTTIKPNPYTVKQ